MARVNVYLPDDLAARARKAGLNISQLTQKALRRALEAGRTEEWLDEVASLRPTGIGHDDVAAAVSGAKDELEGRD